MTRPLASTRSRRRRSRTRGKGYALLAKLGVIRAARAAGLRALGTANDYENLPMLAVNRRLGYRPTAVRGEFELEA